MKIRLECLSCDAVCRIKGDEMDENIYEIKFCPYCASDNIEFYYEEQEEE